MILVTLGLVWSKEKSLLDWSARCTPLTSFNWKLTLPPHQISWIWPLRPIFGLQQLQRPLEWGARGWHGNKVGRSIEPVACKELDIQAGKVYGRNKLLHPRLHCGSSLRKGRAWQSLKLHIFQMFAPLQEAKVYIPSLAGENYPWNYLCTQELEMYIGLSWSCAELIARVANVKALSIALRRGGVNKVLVIISNVNTTQWSQKDKLSFHSINASHRVGSSLTVQKLIFFLGLRTHAKNLDHTYHESYWSRGIIWYYISNGN